MIISIKSLVTKTADYLCHNENVTEYTKVKDNLVLNGEILEIPRNSYYKSFEISIILVCTRITRFNEIQHGHDS